MNFTARSFWTLIKCEAWEYRAWWTWIFVACLLPSGAGILWMIIEHQLKNPHAAFFGGPLLIYWCGSLALLESSILALGHASHGVFDEKQEGSQGFWMAWPVPVVLRLYAKATAIAVGWPLLAWLYITILTGGTGLLMIALSPADEAISLLSSTWLTLSKACLGTSVLSFPTVGIWLWHSTHAPKSPWLWGWMTAASVGAVAWFLAGQWNWGGYLALGPAWVAGALLTHTPEAQPWLMAPGAYGICILVGLGALWMAGRRYGHALD